MDAQVQALLSFNLDWRCSIAFGGNEGYFNPIAIVITMPLGPGLEELSSC